MKVYHEVSAFKKVPYPVVTSGIFDGVHLGHQKILTELKNIAHQRKGQTVILTYWPHPKYVLNPNKKDLKLLTTLEEKIGLLDRLGIDHLVCIPFTLNFSQTTSQEFVHDVLKEQIGTRELVIGYDHRFGKNREGSFSYLKTHAGEFGFRVTEIPRQDVNDIAISSTQIRDHILNNRIHLANKLLGRRYCLTGLVVPGQQLGRNIGFPTANIEIAEAYKLIPSNGAYAVLVKMGDQQLSGMMNIGVRPTLGIMPRTIEVHLFEFDGDLYGKKLKIELVKQIRPELKFKDLEQLTARLHQDRKEAVHILQTLAP